MIGVANLQYTVCVAKKRLSQGSSTGRLCSQYTGNEIRVICTVCRPPSCLSIDTVCLCVRVCVYTPDLSLCLGSQTHECARFLKEGAEATLPGVYSNRALL